MSSVHPNRHDFPDHQAEPFQPAVTELRCPKCRSRDLQLTETGEHHTTWDVRKGKLNRSAGYHNPGLMLRVTGKCIACEHLWTVRGAIQITGCVKELDPETLAPVA
jgi:hypothetical protein